MYCDSLKVNVCDNKFKKQLIARSEKQETENYRNKNNSNNNKIESSADSDVSDCVKTILLLLLFLHNFADSNEEIPKVNQETKKKKNERINV